jgi:preprotein translocase subunit SecE
VSDELDSADAVSTGTVTPQRPTGKRSRRRTLDSTADDATEAMVAVAEDDTEKIVVKVKTAKKDTDGASRNPIAFVINYLKQVVAELRKVIWPNRKQMVSYTSVVLAFLVFMVVLIALVDLGLAKLALLVFG